MIADWSLSSCHSHVFNVILEVPFTFIIGFKQILMVICIPALNFFIIPIYRLHLISKSHGWCRNKNVNYYCELWQQFFRFGNGLGFRREQCPSDKWIIRRGYIKSEGSKFENTNLIKEAFPSNSSINSSDDDWNDYEDCEECCGNESDRTFEKTEYLNSFRKMIHMLMFPESQLSTRDVSMMVMAHSIRFHCTYDARDALVWNK